MNMATWRGERRAAPKPARAPLGGRLPYPADGRHPT